MGAYYVDIKIDLRTTKYSQQTGYVTVRFLVMFLKDKGAMMCTLGMPISHHAYQVSSPFVASYACDFTHM